MRCEYTPIVMDFINIRFDNSIEIAVFYKQNRVNWLVINVVLLTALGTKEAANL